MPSGAAAMWHCWSRDNATTDESVSVIHLHSFSRIDEFYTVKEHWGATENREISRTKNAGGNAAKKESKDKAAQTCMNNRLPTHRHSKHRVVGEHKKWEMNLNDILTDWIVTLIFPLEMWASWRPWTREHLNVTQTRSYFAEPRLTYGDPEYVSRVDPLAAGLSHDSAWMFQSDWARLIGFNIRSNVSDFGQLRLVGSTTLFSYIVQTRSIMAFTRFTVDCRMSSPCHWGIVIY